MASTFSAPLPQFRHWHSAGMEMSTRMGRPAGCGNCWCPVVLHSWLSRQRQGRLRRATRQRPTFRSAPGESGGPGCCIPPCSLSQRVGGLRSFRRSRRASAQSSRPDASRSSPQLPRCCKRSSACGSSSQGSQREALWGSGLVLEDGSSFNLTLYISERRKQMTWTMGGADLFYGGVGCVFPFESYRLLHCMLWCTDPESFSADSAASALKRKKRRDTNDEISR